ncbi:MAG TPA: hypothetical protein VK864_03985 [Longimicrobiales bacterium]|nr:hypothetical protein [Longimicrobiales bacterium]
MDRRRGLVLLTLIGLAAACSGKPPQTPAKAAGSVGSGTAEELEPAIVRDLDLVRLATAKFRDVKAAQAAGYPVVRQCLSHPLQGAMGHHFIKRALLDDQLDVEHPEILLYAPAGPDKYELTGVEYIVPYSAWSGQEPPRIFGQALKKSDQLQLWYLHVWAWRENSAGLFADWNAAVKC